jgi:hypothetical protein
MFSGNNIIKINSKEGAEINVSFYYEGTDQTPLYILFPQRDRRSFTLEHSKRHNREMANTVVTLCFWVNVFS